MNYTSQKLNCKPLIGTILSIVVALSLSTRAYAAYSMRLIPNFLFDNKTVYVAENISPRSSTLSSVTISYDSLADLVYYCNERGLSTTLAYNTALSVYVGFVSDDALNIKKFRVASLHGLLGSVDGKVYVAERKDSGGGTVNNTYNYNQTIINPPSVAPSTTPRPGGTVSSVVTDRELQERIYHSVDSLYQYMSLMIDWLRFVDQDISRIYKHLNDNVVPALEAVNNNIISFKNSAVSSLRVACSVLSDSYDVQFNLLGVARSIYSNVSGIASHLDSVISNGVVQVGSASLEARLDKLISMYSKVNSVVLDTAAINGGQIKAAVGGELEDVMFWGLSGKASNRFEVSPLQYTLNGAVEKVSDIVLRGFSLGTSIPDTINADDALLLAGVWQTGGNTFRISDTYNAATGEYVQRIKSFSLDGSERWQMYDKGNGVFLFRCVNLPLDDLPESRFGMSSANGWTSSPWRAAAFAAAANDAAANYVNQFCIYRSYVGFLSKHYSSLDAWKKYLGDLSAAGTPMEIWYVPRSGAVSTTLDRSTIAIPEGDSTITCDRVRITGKYETYDSYTQTADIIAAINRLNGTGIGGDLTAVTSRLDTLINKTSDTVVNVVNNTTYITNVFQLDDDTNVVDTTKDGVGKVSGLFKWLWNNTFKGAFTHADITKLDGLL